MGVKKICIVILLIFIPTVLGYAENTRIVALEKENAILKERLAKMESILTDMGVTFSKEDLLQPREAPQEQQTAQYFLGRGDISNKARSSVRSSCRGDLNRLKHRLDIAKKKRDNNSIEYYTWEYRAQKKRCAKEKQRYK